ncbi:MAG: MgtC/SapB family protein [Sedimentisphaerales bacterium]|nr:MgtC/SapB family protein [Sedimentisphaerales bacterium]
MLWQEDVFNILLATFLGAAIGLERELSGKSAGLRTNLLICLGAAIFTIISKRMTVGDGSTSRIAAQIVTGVGFLGAGALIQDRRGVHGLTTAATIWLVASIGMGCGAGFRELAVVSTLIAIIVLAGLSKLAKPLEKYAKNHKTRHPYYDEDFTDRDRRQDEENSSL